MPLAIPLEVCSLICAAVEDRTELATLCRTSRFFRDEAQRILYRRVNLGRPIRLLRSLALAVTRHPHLAERVHTLALRLPEALVMSPSDGSKIKDTFTACVNLKELRMSCAEMYPYGSQDSIDGWMLKGAPFRLTKFANSYFGIHQYLMDFLDEQPEIRVFSTSRHHGRYPLRDGDLPNLIAISVASLYSLPAARPLQRIETEFQHDYSPLAQYSGTLTTLNLVRESEWDQDTTLSETVIMIADMLPALVHLGITDRTENPADSITERSPMATLNRFSKLETFVLLVPNGFMFFHETSPRVYEMDDEKDLEDLGSAIITACPNLHRVVVGSDVQRLNRVLTYTLTRTPDGRISSNRGYELDSDAVSIFWDP
ncbi:hypothetical protein DFH06DRAFT_434116 [Mycena polygramma]|nr:hypothetical protein DFH06DRAFT_434116 [Mycena polygramma]